MTIVVHHERSEIRPHGVVISTHPHEDKPMKKFIPCLCFIAISAFADWKAVKSVTLEDIRSDKTYSSLLTACQQTLKGDMRSKETVPLSVALPPGWERVSKDSRVKQFRYWISDKHVEGESKEGRVILFDPEPERLAAWIANAVIETSPVGLYVNERALQFVQQIKEQSHAQFPIVGLVWEDMENTGHPKAYGFVDGVTVKQAPAAIYKNGVRVTSKLSEAVLNQLLELRWQGGAVPGDFARIASTKKIDIEILYKSMGLPPPDLKGNLFPAYVREKYIEAMGDVRNELLVARAHAIR